MDPPRVSECEARCHQFATITETDTVLAMFYLQDADWDLYRSLLTFAKGGKKKPFFSLDAKSKAAETCTSKGNSENTEMIYERHNKTEDAFDEQAIKSRTADNHDVNGFETIRHIHIPIDHEPYRIRIMSWNIDGLDQDDIEERIHGVCDTIKREKPHVVLLQEVVIEAKKILREKCPEYDLISAVDEDDTPSSSDLDSDTDEDADISLDDLIPVKYYGYYTAILLRWDVTTLDKFKVIPFYTSRMGRNLLYVKCTVKGVKFDFLTSHLESMRDRTEERKKQLTLAFDHVRLADIDRTVIFGGDLNIRDYELCGLPNDVDDLWEVTGARPETKFTWDVEYNDNLPWSHQSKRKPRLRFDRLYIRHCKPQAIVKPVCFELVGKERMRSCHKFPSDHWGLLCHFDIPSRIV